MVRELELVLSAMPGTYLICACGSGGGIEARARQDAVRLNQLVATLVDELVQMWASRGSDRKRSKFYSGPTISS